MKQDLQIFDLIKKEKERQSQGLELIASENYVTDQVLEAMGSVCTNKYAEGYPASSKRFNPCSTTGAQHLTSAFKMDENGTWPMRDCSVPSDRFYDDFAICSWPMLSDYGMLSSGSPAVSERIGGHHLRS